MSVEKINIRFDEDNLTIGDLEDFEDAVGVPLFDALKQVRQYDDEGNLVTDERGRPVMAVNLTAKAMKGLVWITLRQERPGFSLDDARSVKVTALEWVAAEDGSDEENPQGPADAGQLPDSSASPSVESV